MSEALCVVQGPNQSSCQAPGGGAEEAERCPAARAVECVENQAAIDVTDGPPYVVSLPGAAFQALDLAIAVGDLREAAALILATPDPFAAETNRIMDHARERLRLENDQIERSLRLRSLRERKASS